MKVDALAGGRSLAAAVINSFLSFRLIANPCSFNSFGGMSGRRRG
jgi:hypothetical protein